MEPSSLKLEFEKQLKDADIKISAAVEQLDKLKEYKLKLVGGLETLELLTPPDQEEQKPESEIKPEV